jgi:predicted transcriptional regulator YheO
MSARLPIEFVLHDTRDPLHSVCAVQNTITGRKVGSPASDVALARITGQPGPEASVYRVDLPDGRSLKCTSPFHHRVFGLFALLCINLDIRRFQPEPDCFMDRLRTPVDVPGGERVNEILLP